MIVLHGGGAVSALAHLLEIARSFERASQLANLKRYNSPTRPWLAFKRRSHIYVWAFLDQIVKIVVSRFRFQIHVFFSYPMNTYTATLYMFGKC